MQDNRPTPISSCSDGRSTVCIDTKRVLDSCRDRDCFEDARVYLTAFGEEVIASATNVRIRTARLVWAYVGVEPVAFNRGFYKVTVRYYIKIEAEACVGVGGSQTFEGIAVVEKDVVLYGGEGSVISYSSSPENNYCNICDTNTARTNDPVAIVETVEPLVLGTKLTDCPVRPCSCCDGLEIPETISCIIDGELIRQTEGLKLYVSFGIFSIIRIERDAQLLVQATDYSVPDKECVAATNDENPCALFSTMPFPTSSFKTSMNHGTDVVVQRGGNCGCGR